MELTIGYLDEATGSLLLDDELPTGAAADLAEALGEAASVGCARPIQILQAPPATTGATARIGGYWHDDFMVGPGRRSVVRFQGCPIRCQGCWVPETWDAAGGTDVEIGTLADLLLSHQNDGVTILGGEPFAQPDALWTLVCALWRKAPGVHVTVYSGYTRERLERLAETNAAVAGVLETVDILIDGAYVQALAHTEQSDDETRRWTGSTNQRVHYLMPF